MKTKANFLFLGNSHVERFFNENIIEIEKLPIDAVHFDNPEEVLMHLRDTPRLQFPDVIIVDVKLPIYNGFEFANRYQSSYYNSYPDTLLYISCAYLSEKERKQILLNTAITGHLPKPFSKDFFVKEILLKLKGMSSKEQQIRKTYINKKYSV